MWEQLKKDIDEDIREISTDPSWWLSDSEQWLRLRDRVLERIDEIDNETPWSISEPKWWLEMMEVRREMQAIK
jgi:hypothetical protein